MSRSQSSQKNTSFARVVDVHVMTFPHSIKLLVVTEIIDGEDVINVIQIIKSTPVLNILIDT